MGLLDLPDLPTDLFLIVTRYLDPIDIVRCRLVSKSWHREFTDESFLRDVLVREYGESRDVRALAELEFRYMVPSGSDFGQFQDIWRRTLDCDIKTPMGKQSNFQDHHVPIYSWGRYLRMADQQSVLLEEQEQVPTDLLETEWTYDSGLLVYLDMIEVPAYVLLDIE